MWTFDVGLADGTLLNAYRHRWTPCYFHLTADAPTYCCRGDGYYGTVDPGGAVKAVFRTWACCRPTDSEQRALRSASRDFAAVTARVRGASLLTGDLELVGREVGCGVRDLRPA